MSEGSVTSWFKNEGDPVSEGEAIAELETEKSNVDLLAPASGNLGKILVAAGSGAVAVGTKLAEIETDAAAAKQDKPADSSAGHLSSVGGGQAVLCVAGGSCAVDA